MVVKMQMKCRSSGHQKKLIHIVSAILIISLIMAPLLPSMEYLIGPSMQVDKSDVSQDLTPHIPIIIEGNDDFATQNWPGNGSVMSPYIIEGLLIASDDTCISISDTSSQFVIRNCLLSSHNEFEGTGLEILDVHNGMIQNCTITGKERGVWIRDTYFVRFINNTVSGNGRGGAGFSSCTDCEIMNNTFCTNSVKVVTSIDHQSGHGLWLGGCSGCIVRDNIVYDNEGFGIQLHQSTDCIVLNNTLINNGFSLWFQPGESWDVDLSNNSVNGLPVCYLRDLTNCSINTVGYGQLIVYNCSNVNITGSDFSNGTLGIFMKDCESCQVSGANASYGHTGIEIGYSDNCTFIDCIASNNRRAGVLLYDSKTCSILGSTFLRNKYGIWSSWSNSSIIMDSFFDSSSVDLVLGTQTNIRVDRNVLTGDSQSLSVQCWGGTIVNNSVYDNEHGLILEYCENLTLADNIINGTGCFFSEGLNCSIVNNTIESWQEDSMSLYRCEGFIIANNTFLGRGLTIDSGTDEWGMLHQSRFHWFHTVIQNSVNGRPIGYFWQSVNQSIDVSSFGQVIVADSNNITLYNGNFDYTTTPLQIIFSSSCVVEDVVSKGYPEGILLYYTSDCIVTGCTVSGSTVGLHMRSSANSIVHHNQIMDNGDGIYLEIVQNITVMENFIVRNSGYGIRVVFGTNISIYDNTFANNTMGDVKRDYTSSMTSLTSPSESSTSSPTTTSSQSSSTTIPTTPTDSTFSNLLTLGLLSGIVVLVVIIMFGARRATRTS